MPYAINNVVLNDYIPIERMNDNVIVFEPIQPLVIYSSIGGGLTVKEGYRVYFHVSLNGSIFGTPEFYPDTQLGFIDENRRITLSNAKNYAEDIYLCISYELSKNNTRKQIHDWSKDGF